ncbi:MAG: hypothetical protein LBB15_02555 [Puniceicoccales bacterium]|jgi:hypothetical protein|nr:hypothetical protein [Puniceicoccales bacterium]
MKKNKKNVRLRHKYAELAQVFDMLNPILGRERKHVTFTICYATHRERGKTAHHWRAVQRNQMWK